MNREAKTEELTQETKTGELYTISKLIQDSISVVRRDFRVLLKIALLSVIVSLIYHSFFYGGLTGGHLPDSFLYIFLAFLHVVIILFFAAAGIFAINSLSENQPITLSGSLRAAFEKYPFYFWVTILAGLAILGGLILLIVPGIIFGVWFTFSGYAVILEDREGLSALRRSKQLVKGNGWYVFVVFFILYIIYYVLAGTTAGILWVILHLIIKTPLNFKFFIILFDVPAGIVVIPFTASCLLLFKNLREVKGDAVISVPYQFTAKK